MSHIRSHPLTNFDWRVRAIARVVSERASLPRSDVRLLPSTSDVAAFFAMADVAVSNTQGPGETWGLATLEALAAGKAVLAAGNGGTLEQLQHNETALLHPGSNAGSGDACAALSERPRRLFADVAAPSELVHHMCSSHGHRPLFPAARQPGLCMCGAPSARTALTRCLLRCSRELGMGALGGRRVSHRRETLTTCNSRLPRPWLAPPPPLRAAAH